MEILHYIPCLLKRIRQKKRLLKRMKAIGAEIETDDLANVYATLAGSDPEAKRIVMGSHVDSVKNGRNYDSVLGVLTAMEVLETFAEHDIGHRHPLTAMIWKNEERSLYMPAMMVSGIICSKFDEEEMMKSRNVLDGKTTSVKAVPERQCNAPCGS